MLDDVVIGDRFVDIVPGTGSYTLPRFCQPGIVVVNNRRNLSDLQVYPNPGGHFVGQFADVPVTLSAGMAASFSGVEPPEPGNLFASYRGYGITKGPETPGLPPSS
jgi:hypothetical protein